MLEQALQNKIINLLKTAGIYHFKIISANKKGIPDIIGCTPKGIFFAIEVKLPGKKLSELQKLNISIINKNNGIAFKADNLDTIKDFIKQITEE